MHRTGDNAAREIHDTMRSIALAVLLGSLLAACGGCIACSGGHPLIAVTCPPPTATPPPISAFLNYPPSGSNNVPIYVGEIIEQGADAPGEVLTITVSSPSASVPVGAPTIAPSPFPTPFATLPPYTQLGKAPYVAIALPTLLPSTTYSVNDTYPNYDPNNPPVCSTPATRSVGTFRTAR
jgi:hypothetical protein